MATPTNLFEYYTQKGQPLPSLEDRSKLYEQQGLGSAAGYGGTAEQNIALLGKLQVAPTSSVGSILSAAGSAGLEALGGVSAAVSPIIPSAAAPAAVFSTTPSIAPISTSGGVSPVVDSSVPRNEEKQKTFQQLKDDQAAQEEVNRLRVQKEIADIKASLTPAGVAPGASNLVGEYKTLYDASGVTSLESSLTDIRSAKQNLLTGFAQYKRETSTGVVKSIADLKIGRESEAVQEELDKLNAEDLRITDQINSKNRYIETIMGLKEKDYASAVSEYNNEYNKNYQAQQLYNSKASEEQKSSQTYLATVSNLLSNSGISWDSVDDSMKANIYQQELKAGWTPGTLEAFARSKPKTNLLATVNGYTESGQGITTFIYSDEKGNPAVARTVNNLTYQKPKEAELLGGLTTQQRTYLNQIQDNARQDPNIRDFPAIRASYETAKSSVEKKSGTGDIVLMRMIAKITDPTTGVREEEFKTFESAQSTLAQFGIRLTTQMWTGSRLTEYGRNQLMASTEDIYSQRKAAYDTSYKFFESQSTSAGIPSGLVMPYYVAPTGVEGNENDKSYIEQLEKSGFKIIK